MEKRRLGNTDEWLSVLGFGGILVMDEEPDEAARLVTEAIEKGINYFDVAPEYGNAEERLGPALEPYRDHVFLACKTGERLAEGAAFELRRSLERLRTDHLDLYQFHGVTSLEEVDQIMGPGGAMEVFLEARDRGRIRHIGFSAHSEGAAVKLLEMFPFDSVLFPINSQCWTKGNFGPRLMEKAQEKGTGILALKSLAKRPWREGEAKRWPKCWYAPVDTPQEVAAALAFTLSQPVTAVVCPGHEELLRLACDALAEFGPEIQAPASSPTFEGEPLFHTEVWKS